MFLEKKPAHTLRSSKAIKSVLIYERNFDSCILLILFEIVTTFSQTHAHSSWFYYMRVTMFDIQIVIKILDAFYSSIIIITIPLSFIYFVPCDFALRCYLLKTNDNIVLYATRLLCSSNNKLLTTKIRMLSIWLISSVLLHTKMC